MRSIRKIIKRNLSFPVVYCLLCVHSRNILQLICASKWIMKLNIQQWQTVPLIVLGFRSHQTYQQQKPRGNIADKYQRLPSEWIFHVRELFANLRTVKSSFLAATMFVVKSNRSIWIKLEKWFIMKNLLYIHSTQRQRVGLLTCVRFAVERGENCYEILQSNLSFSFKSKNIIVIIFPHIYENSI